MKVLYIYPNCSLGGMGTVYRNRILANQEIEHWAFFQKDAGALFEFEKLPNTNVRIISPTRIDAFLKACAQKVLFREICITSLYSCLHSLERKPGQKIVYEFHSSTEGVIAKEASNLRYEVIDEIRVPSAYLKEVVAEHIPEQYQHLISVLPNLIDRGLFNETVEPGNFQFGGSIPLIWVGRFDLGKNVREFLRILSLTPENYLGVIVTSLEHEATRAEEFLSEAFAFGVQDRIEFLLNLPQSQMSALYRQAAIAGGKYCSTSLGESFGFTVAESIACGLPAVAYDVGALSEHADELLQLINVGDAKAFASAILTSPRHDGGFDSDFCEDAWQKHLNRA